MTPTEILVIGLLVLALIFTIADTYAVSKRDAPRRFNRKPSRFKRR